jgi:hypothetical protein
MEKLKGLMRREGVKSYRKGGDKLERKVKKSTNNEEKAMNKVKRKRRALSTRLKVKIVT